MVETVKYTETLTDHFYDTERPVTYDEDKEACDIGIEAFATEISNQCEEAFSRGWYGWNRASECSTQHLIQKMKKAFSEGDTVKVGVYLMMLNSRGVSNFELDAVKIRLAEIGKEIERLVNAEDVVLQLSNDGSHIQQVIRDIHDGMNNLDKERLRLLKKLA